MSTDKQSPRGQLVEHVAGYHTYLLELGYSLSAANKHRHLVTHLSRWLERESIALHELTAPATQGFFNTRRARGTPDLRTPRSLVPLLDYLGSHGVVGVPIVVPPSDPVPAFCERYRRHLLVQRGVTHGTAHFYVYVAGLLAGEHRDGEVLDWSSLRAGHVTDFVVRTCTGRGLCSARQVVSALRSSLRFLAMEGLTESSLDDGPPGRRPKFGSSPGDRFFRRRGAGRSVRR